MGCSSLTSEIRLTYHAVMTITEQLLTEIEAFLLRHNMAATEFGRQAVSDPHTVRWLRAGNGITTKRYERLRAFMAAFDTPRKKSPSPAAGGRRRPAA